MQQEQIQWEQISEKGKLTAVAMTEKLEGEEGYIKKKLT